MPHHIQSGAPLKRWPQLILLTLITLLFTGSLASAADYYWMNPVSGNFATSSNWAPAGVPEINDTGIFNLGSAGYSVSGFFNVKNIEINNDTVVFPADGEVRNNVLIGVDAESQGSMLVNDFATLAILPPGNESSALVVGVAGSGNLSVVKSGYVTVGGDFMVAQDAGSTGTVTVDGSSARLSTPQSFAVQMRSATIGAGGEGSLSMINGGGTLLAGPFVIGRDVGSRGTVSVDGEDSWMSVLYDGDKLTTLTVGESGEGSLSVSGGAAAYVPGPIIIGRNIGSRGTVSVDGLNSLLSSSNNGGERRSIIVGESGEGSLSVTRGAFADIKDVLMVGKNTGSEGTVTVDGSGSILGGDNLQSITIGDEGSGSLSIINGGRTSFDNIFMTIGAAVGSQGIVTVDGTNSLIKSRLLIVADKGTGSLSATNGATVAIENSIVIAAEAGLIGTVTFDHATLGNTGSVTVGAEGNGTLTLSNGTVADIEKLVIGKEADSEGTVKVDGSGSILDNKGWNITVGESGKGSLSVTRGALVASVGTLIIGKEVGSEGKVEIDGSGSILGDNGSRDITVGESGKGSLSVMRGASVTSMSILIVGLEAGSEGTVKIAGSSSILGNNVAIGYEGTGSLSISNNSRMNVSSFDVGTYAGSGILTLDSGSSLNATNFVIGERGIVQIGDGSSVIADRVYNRGLLQVDGTLEGNVFQATGQIGGNGSITGEVDLRGSSVAPGDSPGKLTVGSLDAADSIFEFEINSANGTAGGTTGWDLLSSLGGIRLFGDDFTIDLKSLDQSNSPGQIFDFDPTHDYHWAFLTGSSILLFDPADFHIDLSNFANPIHGQFDVSQVGNSLVLNYTAVPEVGTMAMTSIGLGVVLLAGWYRGRRSNVGC